MTTSETAFIRSIVRITIIQLLRSIGFTKSNNTLIDIITDLYIRYFDLLVSKTKRFQQLRNEVEHDENTVLVQDIQQLIDELLLIRPSNPLDLYDIDPINDQYCEVLENWVYGPTPDRARDLSKPNLKYIRSKKIEDLENKLNRVGLGGMINSNTYSFSSKTKEEIELEKLLNNEVTINAPDDFLQYLLTNSGDAGFKQKLKSTFLQDQLYNDSEFEDFDNGEQDQPQQEPAFTHPGTTPGHQDHSTEDPKEEDQKIKEELPESDEPVNKDKSASQPEYVVVGPTPEGLEEHLPYNVKYEIKEFDIARYLNEQNKHLLQYHAKPPTIEFHDELDHIDDGQENTGFQLGGW